MAGGEGEPVVAEVIDHLHLLGLHDLLPATVYTNSPCTVVTRISSPCSSWSMSPKGAP